MSAVVPRTLGYLALVVEATALCRAVIGQLAHEEVLATIRESAQVADRHAELVGEMSWWLNIGWIVFGVLNLTAAVLLLHSRTGRFLLLWTNVTFGAPLTLAAVGLPTATPVSVANAVAVGSLAAVVVVNVVTWPRAVRR